MSRLTAAQVISLGEYLEPDFNPTSLTVSQLLGVLGYHNVPYPMPYSKPKLIQVFNDEIQARSTKFKKERLKAASSIASDEGIMDGVTGKPLNGGRQPQATPSRRSSRRLSQAPIEIEDDSPPPVPKRRRSSAQPALGGTSRRKAAPASVPTLAEESEPEEEPLPPKKVGKIKKTSMATEARKITEKAEDSGWEDNNIFQSGAESSSPARPTPARRAPRKSLIPKSKARKSTSAPPQIDSSPTRSSPFSPQQTSFNPDFGRLPPPRFSPSPRQKSIRANLFNPQDVSVDELNIVPEVKEEEERRSPSLKEEDEDNAFFGGDDELRYPDDGSPVLEEEDAVEKYEENNEYDQVAEEEGEEGEDEEGSELAEAVELQEKEHPSRALILHTPRSSALQLFYQVVAVLILLSFGYGVFNYKTESASIGFCDPGSNTNNALEALRSRRVATEVCNRENRTTLYLPSLGSLSSEGEQTPCPLPPLVPLPHPDTCTPCPEHGTCTQFGVQCDNGYLRRPPALLGFLPAPPSSFNLSFSSSLSPSELVWTAISAGLNGLPGLGSIALPPRCVPDPKRQRNIGVLGKAMGSILAQERGRRLCVGGPNLDKEYNDAEGGEARKWGVEIEQLREMMKRKTSPRLKPTFDDTFNEAIQELVQWGGVVLGTGNDEHQYLASREADLTWDCVLTVKSREVWEAWRTTALGGAAAVVAVILARLKVAQKQSESRRVSELVQIALDTLRNQELAHHTDPVTTPQPYLSSIQLRDVILQNEHSIPTRRRLWDQVEHIVEGNANVRANLEEIEGGDELRVWRWVGSTGRGLM
ncbi:Man1-Src1p-C-terminal domain-containing protein [Ephemerocybe angulata]|uniref:Man1-Src1p-C-terminal domain-containing protein n=1 Tax=Ephemerocybe angulata TaxID=980116 RepID=A0A8H6MGQ4_9AGAR|nr:Man1-Src1p-C-terminal domain-containing protein [Tulosesus angulatus]